MESAAKMAVTIMMNSFIVDGQEQASGVPDFLLCDAPHIRH